MGLITEDTAKQVEEDEVATWSATLPKVTVANWGGMISTPDESLQTAVKSALLEHNCPPHIIDQLMENCHERKWPAGLNSLETRMNYRGQYANYVCKRIPGTQAIIVLHRDNKHMPEDMIIEPGLVMIFAHGIE